MVILILIVIAVLLIAIFSAITAKQRAEAKAAARQQIADDMARNPRKNIALFVGLGAGGLTIAAAIAAGASFGGIVLLTLVAAVAVFVAMMMGERADHDARYEASSRVVTPQAHALPPEVTITSKDYSEIIRLTLETVYEQGTGWIPKTRSPSEYLREIERRYTETPAKQPVRLSAAVLEIVRADCEGYSNVIAAIDRAAKIEPTMDAILFPEAAT